MAILSDRIMLKDIRAFEVSQRHPAYLTNARNVEALGRAEEYLSDYEKDELKVMAKDYKLFAEYINAFGGDKRDNLLNKLQDSASFDIREYLDSHRIVAYGQQKEYENYLDFQKLRQFMGAYNALKNLRRNDKLTPDDGYNLLNMIASSENYVRDFLNNKFDLYTDDIPLFKRYIQITLENNDQLCRRALDKIETGDYNVREYETPKSSAEKFGEKLLLKISSFKSKAKSFFAGTKKKISGFFKNILSHSENIQVKASPSIVTVAAVTALTLVSDTHAKQMSTQREYNFKNKHEIKTKSEDNDNEKTAAYGRTKIIEDINADILKEHSIRTARKNISKINPHNFRNLKELREARARLNKSGR